MNVGNAIFLGAAAVGIGLMATRLKSMRDLNPQKTIFSALALLCLFASMSAPALAASTASTSIASACASFSLSRYNLADIKDDIEVSGAQLARANAAWVPKGVNLEYFAQPLYLSPRFPTGGFGATPSGLGKKIYGCDELSAISEYGADTIRFQVSQTTLAASSATSYQNIVDYYYPNCTSASQAATCAQALKTLENYLPNLVTAVGQARASGFAVIVSMQDQEGSIWNADNPTAPTAATETAWANLIHGLGKLADDKGIMYELYNEPVYSYSAPWSASTDAEIWEKWQSGDTANGNTLVGHQALVDYMRDTLGVANVLIVDGVQGAAWVSTASNDPLNSNGEALNHLTDSKDSIVYAVHPYPGSGGSHSGNNGTAWQWDHNFGIFSENSPVIATEWNSSSLVSCRLAASLGENAAAAESAIVAGTTKADSARIAYDFLTYAKSHAIGVIGWAFDYPNQLVSDFTSYAPTEYNDVSFACDPAAPNNKSNNQYAGGGGLFLKAMWEGAPYKVFTSSSGDYKTPVAEGWDYYDNHGNFTGNETDNSDGTINYYNKAGFLTGILETNGTTCTVPKPGKTTASNGAYKVAWCDGWLYYSASGAYMAHEVDTNGATLLYDHNGNLINQPWSWNASSGLVVR